jgi:hypothetical protein
LGKDSEGASWLNIDSILDYDDVLHNGYPTFAEHLDSKRCHLLLVSRDGTVKFGSSLLDLFLEEATYLNDPSLFHTVDFYHEDFPNRCMEMAMS